MGGIGVLEAAHPDTALDAVKPGGTGAASLARTRQRGPSETDAIESMLSSVVAETVARAERRVERIRTSTTVAALAQCYRTGDSAVATARDALALSLVPAENGVVDPISARIAVEVLVGNGHADAAFDALMAAPEMDELRLTRAAVAIALDRRDDASQAVAGLDGYEAAAYRGYLAAEDDRWSDAVRELRSAIRQNPDDLESTLNLSVAFWRQGSVRKSMRLALQATRMAPGRKDASLHYIDLLLRQGLIDEADAEVRAVRAQGVLEDAQLSVMRARIKLARGREDEGLALLRRAAELAHGDHDLATRAEVLSNVVGMRFERGELDRQSAVNELRKIVEMCPESDVAVVRYAQLCSLRSESPPIRAALEGIRHLEPAYDAFLRCQLAVLEGDSGAAGLWAGEWFRLEPKNAGAATTAIVAIGIGQERWAEASLIADHALREFPHEKSIVNNAAYVLAMSGRAQEAIAVVERFGPSDFVLKATLGLAYMAAGDLETGTRLYRLAADDAEKIDPVWRSLMTAYQAMIVRQLELLDNRAELESMLLVPVELPPDWQDRSDFIRLQQLFDDHGYPWPPTPDLSTN